MTSMISVIMPVYNGQKYLSTTIDSILSQTYSDFEFIIINDCSTDNSSSILEKYSAIDKKIKIINNKHNLGISDASNKGLKVAKGKYIAMIDQDDISLKDRFACQVEYLENNPDVYLIGTGNANIDQNGKYININKTITNYNKIKRDMINGTNRICHPSIMYRNTQEVFYRQKIYFAQDVDFFLQLLTRQKKLTNIKKMLLNYRIHPVQTSMTKRNKQLLFSKKASEFYMQREVKGRDEYDKFNPEKIFKINSKISKDKDVIRSEIFFNFQRRNLKDMRYFAIKYFKYFGYCNKILIYYLISYLPEKLVNWIHKTKRRYF